MSAPTSRRIGWPVWFVVGLLGVVLAGFLFFALTFRPEPAPDAAHAAMPDRAALETLVAAGSPARGETLTVEFGCAACHVQGAANDVAPPFEGVAGRAGQRQPGLDAPAYLYQSIVDPTAYFVDGFPHVMPENFADRLTQQQVADIVAYLLAS